MNESPKQRFQKTTHAKVWLDAVDSPTFHAASDAALLQYGVQLGSPDEITDAAANEFKRQGAREFLHLLANLSVVGESTAKKKARTVDHSV